MFRFQRIGQQLVRRETFLYSPRAKLVQPYLFNTQRQYVIVHKDLQKAKKEPRIRYILYMIALSWAAIFFVSSKVDKKKPMQSMTEREFQEYEKQTGIKRRHKLIHSDQNSKYKFYVIPYIHNNEQIEKIEQSLAKSDPNRKNVVIDPAKLVLEEKEDEGAKYSALLNDLDAMKKPYPPGLITAIIKQHINLLINTREGTFDTNYIIKNYPQTTGEAIKFENDIGDISKCLIMHYDMLNELPQQLPEEKVRNIRNVEGYFDSVNKAQTMVSKFDIMDEKFEEIILEDL